MRVTVESWAFQDPRLFMLMDELSATRRECLGLLLDVWYGTQEAHLVKAPIKMVRALCRPDGAPWTADEAFAALLAVGYIVDSGDGTVHIRGNDRPVSKMAAAKASIAVRWNNERNTNVIRTYNERNTDPDPDPDPDKKKEEKRESTGLSAVADPPSLPVSNLVKLWADLAPGQPQVKVLTTSRKKHAQARLREHPDLDYWREVIRRLIASPFCRGANDRGWRADFDFLIKPDTHAKALEGKYDEATAADGIDWAAVGKAWDK